MPVYYKMMSNVPSSVYSLKMIDDKFTQSKRAGA